MAAIRAWVDVNGWDVEEASEYWLLELRQVPRDSPEWIAFFEKFAEKKGEAQ